MIPAFKPKLDNISIDPSENSPEVTFLVSGDFSIRGISIMENAAAFYIPILEWVVKYVSGNYAPKTRLSLEIEYLNTASYRYLFEILKELKKSNSVEITWIYEADDEDAYEIGSDLQQVLNLPFTFEEK